MGSFDINSFGQFSTIRGNQRLVTIKLDDPTVDRSDFVFVGHAQKPSRKGYRRALEKFKTPQEHTAMLGDKLLTDILGAKRSGVLALMVEPKGGARGPWQKVLHALQEPFKRASAHDERTARQ